MMPRFNHEGSGLKRILAGIGIAMGVLLLTAVSALSQDYPPGKLWVTFYEGAFDSLETDTNGNMVYRLSYLDSVNIANECSTIVSDSVAGLDSSKWEYMVYFPENADLPAIADAYLNDPEGKVRFARPDYYIEFLYTPNDLLFDRQGSSMECHQWGMDSSHCQFEKAWDITKGDTSVVIAMIDIGILYSHPELKDKLWFNGPEDINNPGTFEPWPSDSLRNGKYGDFDGEDQDGNHFIDDVVGWNFLDGDSTPYIDSLTEIGHGTITSSIAAGMTDNEIGIAGAAPNCRLMLLTGIPDWLTTSWALKCLRYAGLMRADVINMSWYTPAGSDPAIHTAVNLLHRMGINLVAAAGNYDGHKQIFPAGYDSVLSVAGTDTLDTPHPVSDYDATVDLSAPIKTWAAHFGPESPYPPTYKYNAYGCPAEDIHPCELDDQDTLGCLPPGTSISAPFVSGTVALVRAAYPNMTNTEIMAKLKTSTDPLKWTPGSVQESTRVAQGWFGTGRLNAYKAVTFFGNIPNSASDTTLDGVVYVSGDIIVPVGKTLTLAAGTTLKFLSGDVMPSTGNPSPGKGQLIVKGTLTCLGSESDSIILTSFQSSPQAGDWAGVLIDTNGRANIEFTRFSYADTALAVRGDTATVVVYNSTFNYFDKAAVSSRSYKTKLGGIYPVPNPPDCGRNNFLMSTATSGAKAVIKSSSPTGTIKAEGNWWDSVPPPSSYFSGNVNRTPYLTAEATPDSCGAGQQYSEPPPGEKVAVRPSIPTHFELGQNYPNPFNPTATIQYALPQAVKVELRVFNILGQVVTTLVNQEQAPGYYQIVWDGKDEEGRTVSTGVYLYQIKAGDFIETKKMQLIK